MEGIFIKLLNMSIAAGWLILAVLALRIILKSMPKRMRCILWGFVGVRLVCPYAVESVLSLIPSAETVSQDIAYQRQPTIHSGIEALNQTVNPVFSETFAPEVSVSVGPLQVWIFLASVVWVLGMVLMAVYAVASYWKLHQKIRESVRWEENLYVCDHIDTPFIFGVVRPRIYLPSAMAENQIEYVKAHERAHLARRDHIWKLLGFVLLSVYWFHPLCWAAYRLFCKDLEFACDEKVVRDFDVCSRKEYAEALLECSINCHRIAAYPLAFGEVNVKERIRNVLSYKKPAFWTIVFAAAVCIIVAVCFLTNPRRPASELFGHSYTVEEIVYESPLLSVMLEPETAPSYSVTEEGRLMEKRSPLLYGEEASKEWVVCGNVDEITLTDNNFDQYVYWNGPILTPMISPEELREQNKKAWYVDSEAEGGTFYYILQQKNGDIYLADGSDRGDSQIKMGPCNFWRIVKLQEKGDL